MVYNLNSPEEKFIAALRISFGKVLNFVLPPSSKSSAAYMALEQHIMRFLSEGCAQRELLFSSTSLVGGTGEHYDIMFVVGTFLLDVSVFIHRGPTDTLWNQGLYWRGLHSPEQLAVPVPSSDGVCSWITLLELFLIMNAPTH